MGSKKEQYINVNIEGLTLTPITCARIVNEILKCLAYQKSQIPYPYVWLQSIVNKKRSCGNSGRTNNLSAQRNFHAASTAFDALEAIMKNIVAEFTGCTSYFYEVMILFGATPVTPKEVYTIRIPNVARGHIESNHQNMYRNQQKILRNICFSDIWLKSMDILLPCTNIYVMLKKSSPLNTKGFFQENSEFSVNSNVKNTIINLYYNNKKDLCCDNLQVFQDDPNNCNVPEETEVSCSNESRKGTWFQANALVKGFKDSYVNKVSVSELW